jgi:hypothetical protein
MSQVLTVAGAASLPYIDGGTVAAINLATSLGYTARADFVRNYSGAIAADPVNMGTLATPGAKGVLVVCTQGAATIQFQSTTNEAWPLDPGGYFLWIDTARPFVTAAFITTLAAAAVIFIAVG